MKGIELTLTRGPVLITLTKCSRTVTVEHGNTSTGSYNHSLRTMETETGAERLLEQLLGNFTASAYTSNNLEYTL